MVAAPPKALSAQSPPAFGSPRSEGNSLLHEVHTYRAERNAARQSHRDSRLPNPSPPPALLLPLSLQHFFLTSLRRRWLPQVRDLAALAPASWPDCNDVFAEAPLTATRLAVPRCNSRRRLAPLAALLRDAVLAPLKAAGLNAVALAVAAAFEVSHGTGMT